MSYYRQVIPQLGLSIERNCGSVPSDGKYYVVMQGKILESFRSFKKADEKYRQIIKETGLKFEKPKNKPQTTIEEGIERYLDAKAVFYAEGPISRKKGGRGGRGGI